MGTELVGLGVGIGREEIDKWRLRGTVVCINVGEWGIYIVSQLRQTWHVYKEAEVEVGGYAYEFNIDI